MANVATSGQGVFLVYSNVLGADTATLDTGANAIPANGSVLEVLVYARTDEAAALSTVGLRFNGDAGANYDRELLLGANASVSATPSNAATSAVLATVAGASATAGVFSVIRGILPAYAGTTGNKSGMVTTGAPDQTAANMRAGLASIEWRNTAAINQATIVITSGAGQKFKAGSAIYVYVR